MQTHPTILNILSSGCRKSVKFRSLYNFFQTDLIERSWVITTLPQILSCVEAVYLMNKLSEQRVGGSKIVGRRIRIEYATGFS